MTQVIGRSAPKYKASGPVIELGWKALQQYPRGVWYSSQGSQRRGCKRFGADNRSLVVLSTRLTFFYLNSNIGGVSSGDGLGIHEPRSRLGRARDRAICPAVARFQFRRRDSKAPFRCGGSGDATTYRYRDAGACSGLVVSSGMGRAFEIAPRNGGFISRPAASGAVWPEQADPSGQRPGDLTRPPRFSSRGGVESRHAVQSEFGLANARMADCMEGERQLIAGVATGPRETNARGLGRERASSRCPMQRCVGHRLHQFAEAA